MNNIVLVVCHKQGSPETDPVYKTIAVGKNKHELSTDLYDDVGENITDKNESYCELTAQYWAWKNLDCDYGFVGLCHYRRFFASSRMNRHGIATERQIERYLKRADVIVPDKWYWRESVAEKYFKFGQGKECDLQVTRDVIEQCFPDYLEYYDEHLSSHSGSYCNMMITNQKLFNEYSEWLFQILGKVEDRIDLSSYNPAETRVFGYLSELLLNVWIKRNGLRAKHLPMVETEASKRDRLVRSFENTKRRLRL